MSPEKLAKELAAQQQLVDSLRNEVANPKTGPTAQRIVRLTKQHEELLQQIAQAKADLKALPSLLAKAEKDLQELQLQSKASSDAQLRKVLKLKEALATAESQLFLRQLKSEKESS